MLYLVYAPIELLMNRGLINATSTLHHVTRVPHDSEEAHEENRIFIYNDRHFAWRNNKNALIHAFVLCEGQQRKNWRTIKQIEEDSRSKRLAKVREWVCRVAHKTRRP